MYSLPKGKLLVSNRSAYVFNVKRLNNSYRGNPQFEIAFTYKKDATLSDFTAKTEANSMLAYKICPHWTKGKQFYLTLTKPRKNLYIKEMTEVQDV